jgi:hypothetical protein
MLEEGRRFHLLLHVTRNIKEIGGSRITFATRIYEKRNALKRPLTFYFRFHPATTPDNTQQSSVILTRVIKPGFHLAAVANNDSANTVGGNTILPHEAFPFSSYSVLLSPTLGSQNTTEHVSTQENMGSRNELGRTGRQIEAVK